MIGIFHDPWFWAFAWTHACGIFLLYSVNDPYYTIEHLGIWFWPIVLPVEIFFIAFLIGLEWFLLTVHFKSQDWGFKKKK